MIPPPVRRLVMVDNREVEVLFLKRLEAELEAFNVCFLFWRPSSYNLTKACFMECL